MKSTVNEEWIGVSDIMTGLMMVFLFACVVFIQQIDSEKRSIEEIAFTYAQYRDQLQNELLEEFQPDLMRWNAEILEDSTIRFNEPDVLFDRGSKDIKPRFEAILDDFFPRYVGVLGSEKFRDLIMELRIEGHTSSTWDGRVNLEQRYLKNAQLSQQRSFSILEYCFTIPAIYPYREWLTKVIRANGLAFANPIMVGGIEDHARSRRVEFKVRTQAEDRIIEIIEKSEEQRGTS